MGADSKPVHKKLDQNLGYIKEHLEPGEKNFDLILKEIVIGGKRAALLFVDGFIDSTTTTLILRELLKARREEIIPETVDKMLLAVIPYPAAANLVEFLFWSGIRPGEAAALASSGAAPCPRRRAPRTTSR